MRVQNEAELVTFGDWTVRVRRSVQEPTRLLLLLHGWTGDENSMWVFVRGLSPDYCIIAPRGPHTTEPSGFSWRPRQLGEHDRPTFENLRPAVDSLMAFIDAYAAAHQLDALTFDAMGFSQGAALLAALALMHPERVRRSAILAGFVPEGAQSLIDKHPLQDKPVFVAHGTRDERVPVEFARRSVQVLEQAGAQVTYCEDDVGHKLSIRCLHALESFFA